jgi:hypothetical protein
MALFASPLVSYRKPHVLGFILYFIVGLVDGAIVPFFPLWAQQSAAIPVEFIGLLIPTAVGIPLVLLAVTGLGLALSAGDKSANR